MSRSTWYGKCALVLAIALVALAGSAARVVAEPGVRVYLHNGWQVQSSCVAKAAGEQISTVGFDAASWHKTDLPATVVGALVTDKTYPDPYFGTNLKTLPGMNYSNKSFFAIQDMPAGSPFLCSWWFRTEFAAPADLGQKNSWLHFLGINYRANVWINGVKIGDAKDVAGTYRAFEFNVSKNIQAGKTNALALEIFAPHKDDLGITWVDWNPTPADRDMGIWKEVFLTTSGDVSVRHPFVVSKLDSEYKTAALTVSADLRNTSDHAVKGILHGNIDGIQLEQPVELEAGESRKISFAPEKFSQMKLEHPRIWWPYQMGEPNLYTARLSFDSDGQTSDAASVTFGIREVTSEITDKGYRLFKINGRKLLIRGAAWAPDMFLRWSSERLDADLAYVRDMGLNTIRLEGRLDHDEFFDKTDKLGILVMPGWTCCDAWERWKLWKGDQRKVAASSLTDQIGRLRNHPSVFVWLNGSDGPPPAYVERMYLGIEKDLGWPNPIISSASAERTTVTGKSGVKMTGPYEYVPPVYWLSDKKAGGAYGYNTETSPGPAIPPRESLERFIPKDHLWPIDDVWNYHSGGERFTTVNVFTDGLTKRYGAATSLDDYERKAQAMTYDGQRAMFEAYGRNKYTSTGVIQWMLNNGWPSLIWHLYDYYLVPAGGYFGTKKAMEPVHVQYSYDDNSVAVVNSTYEALKGTKVSAKIYNIDAAEKALRDVTLDLAADSSTKAFDLPKVDGLSKTYFLRLQLSDAGGKQLSDNFYWLSTKPDTLNWAKQQDTVYTPQAEFGDLTGLNSLPQVKLNANVVSGNGTAQVTVSNPSSAIAFMVHLRVTRGKGGVDLTPIFWEDNYFSLLPGESRTVAAKFDQASLDGKEAVVVLDGWNVPPITP
ncbi:MAG TPA: glycoside hydrolase family 2 protein [Candidatus Acidoferrum sp.]|nr:glycoside hydrolase family 2 protein [Candidatus Acidoferrum sp.]